MRVNDDDRHFDVAGEHRGDRRPCDAQLREAERAEDQQVIEHEVHQDADDACEHGQLRLADLAQRARVDLRHRKGQQPGQHDHQVIHAVGQRAGGVGGVRPLRQIGRDQLLRHGEEDAAGRREHRQRNVPLHAEAVAHALVVLCPGELRGKDARARQSAKDAEIEDEQELIDNGDGRHLERADPADHHVVQKADDVGHRILDDDRHNNGDDLRVKCAVADELGTQPSP